MLAGINIRHLIVTLLIPFISQSLVCALPDTPASSACDPDLCNCTETDSDKRSLYSIVWGCLVTIVACTWVTVHPNLPSPQDRARGWPYTMRQRALGTGAMLIAPELVMAWALEEWVLASSFAKRAQLFRDPTTDPHVTIVHGYMLVMNGFVDTDGRPINMRHLECLDWSFMPSENELMDKSKSDNVGKLLAVLQTLWFGLRCIARGCQHFEITQLEVFTLALASLNGIIYVIWWGKPKDIMCPIVVPVKDVEPLRRSDIYSGSGGYSDIAQAKLLCVAGIIFGALHCIAWKSLFPSDVEATLWRATALVVTILPVTYLGFVVLYHTVGFEMHDWYGIPIFALYSVSRVILIVLAFTALRKLPDSAYQDINWTQFIPHL